MNLMDSKVGLPYFVDLGVNLTYLGMHFVDLRMCFEDLGMDSKTGSVGLRMDFVDACEVEFDARILHPQPEWAYLVPDSMLRRGSFSTTPCAIAAQGLLKRTYSVLNNPKHMVPTCPETGARLLVTRFLKSFIAAGCTIIRGYDVHIEGTEKKSSLKVYLRGHSPQFYWKGQVATQGDLVFADAFIRGDFSFVDKNSGLLNLFMSEEEDLKVAQERKISLIIEKPSDEASRPISPMDVRRSRDDNDLNDIL
ncbi:hypothetical protein FXO38_18579 [Capsicum annuum]|nr:hypothetical protein FXO38_18579 [Capsicum annuum]KAF3679192.1 hypothetical protein FXO37_04002 [Capsicum annuum]